MAENQFGESDQKSVEIFVPKLTRFVTSGPEVVQVHVGEDLRLSCDADVDVDESLKSFSKLVWTKNGQVFDAEEKSVFVKKVSDGGDETNGKYECRLVICFLLQLLIGDHLTESPYNLYFD